MVRLGTRTLVWKQKNVKQKTLFFNIISASTTLFKSLGIADQMLSRSLMSKGKLQGRTTTLFRSMCIVAGTRLKIQKMSALQKAKFKKSSQKLVWAFTSSKTTMMSWNSTKIQSRTLSTPSTSLYLTIWLRLCTSIFNRQSWRTSLTGLVSSLLKSTDT